MILLTNAQVDWNKHGADFTGYLDSTSDLHAILDILEE
jgi:hypothetical protein